jgi:hypothetical protein
MRVLQWAFWGADANPVFRREAAALASLAYRIEALLPPEDEG